MSRPTAAVGSFPYPHRTMAEVERFDLDHLTRREREVADRVAQGMSSKEIARALGISPRTVEMFRASAMKKFGTRNAAQFVAAYAAAAPTPERT